MMFCWTGSKAFVALPRFKPVVSSFGSHLNIGFASLTTLSANNDVDSITNVEPKKIAIVGGGLAGLSTAFHLLELATSSKGMSLDITILDKEPHAGIGGASAVAGGLVHPLSPRGKLAYLGREGILATNHLIEAACKAPGMDAAQIVLRNEIFRVATNLKQAKQLQATALESPEYCEWLDQAPASSYSGEASSNFFGALRLYNGCQVLHLPSYLQGLWAACQHAQPPHKVQWQKQNLHQLLPSATTTSGQLLDQFDAVVWTAGSGLFEKEDTVDWLFHHLSPPAEGDGPFFPPIQLVRGQSIQMRLPTTSSATINRDMPAMMGGKYVSPLPDPNLILIGATHEFDEEPWSHDKVREELRERAEVLSPHLWENENAVIECYTIGTRVQSERCPRGRLPIIGKLRTRDAMSTDTRSSSTTDSRHRQQNHWIFTGLSSRGLLYHGFYGKLLAGAIIEGSEHCLEKDCSGFDWWRQPRRGGGKR